MGRNVVLWVALLLLLAGCCPVTSIHPLAPTPQTPIDQRLAGIWKLDAKEDNVILHIGRTEGNNSLQVVLVEHRSDSTLKQAVFDLTATTIGPQNFLTLSLDKVSDEQNEGHDGHIILKYTLSDAYTLSLRRLNLEAVAAAVQTNQLAGEIEYDQSAIQDGDKDAGDEFRKIACARITADTKDLKAFIARQQSDDLFQPYLKFKRLPCVPRE